jgi:hypothetical protein
MPSKEQSTARNTPYDSEPEKVLATKNDATIRAVVRGMRRVERARDYAQAEIRLANRENREPRKKLIGLLNGRIAELQDPDRDDDFAVETGVDSDAE